MECISLPEDLVEQILYRVPIKSVARWRSTSKQWNALLKSKRFLKTHAAYAYAPRLRLFPVPTTRRYDLRRETYVVLEMGVGDYLSPEKFNPSSIVWQIEAAMQKEDYLGEVFIRAFGAEDTWSPELESEYEGSTIEVHQYKGVKRTRLNMFIADFLITLNVISRPSNFLLLSENIDYMEQHPKFARFHQTLLDRGFFVVLAHPHTLISQETEPDKSAIDPDQTGSEMSAYFQSVRL